MESVVERCALERERVCESAIESSFRALFSSLPSPQPTELSMFDAIGGLNELALWNTISDLWYTSGLCSASTHRSLI